MFEYFCISITIIRYFLTSSILILSGSKIWDLSSSTNGAFDDNTDSADVFFANPATGPVDNSNDGDFDPDDVADVAATDFNDDSKTGNFDADVAVTGGFVNKFNDATDDGDFVVTDFDADCDFVATDFDTDVADTGFNDDVSDTGGFVGNSIATTGSVNKFNDATDDGDFVVTDFDADGSDTGFNDATDCDFVATDFDTDVADTGFNDDVSDTGGFVGNSVTSAGCVNKFNDATRAD